MTQRWPPKVVTRFDVKLHLLRWLFAARIDILPFFFLKSHSHLHGARFKWDFVGAISPDPPPKTLNRSSHSHGRDFNAILAYDCNSQKSLTRWDCEPVILAKSSRWKSCYRAGSLTRWEIVLKGGLLVLNLWEPTAAKALQMLSLSGFAFETITLRNFEKKLYEANASVKRNRVNAIKQLMSLKLAVKMQGERWSSKGGVLLVQNVWYINVWNYSKKLTYSVSFWVGLDGARWSGH